MRIAIVTCLCLALASTANAATVSYELLVNGSPADFQNPAPGTQTLEVQVIVTDNDLTGGGVHGGLLQSAFDLSNDVPGAVQWTDTTGGFIGGPNGLWDSTANSDFDSHFQGTLAGLGTQVIAETGAIAPGDFTAQFGDIGANVLTTVTIGDFVWDGTPTTISLDVANPFGGDLVVAALSGASIVGAVPDAVNNDTITLGVPEPGTFVLAGLAGLMGFVSTRRRS